jgi:hypothetical protein
LREIPFHQRVERRRRRNKHILLLMYHFIVSITGVLKKIDFVFKPLFVSQKICNVYIVCKCEKEG